MNLALAKHLHTNMADICKIISNKVNDQQF